MTAGGCAAPREVDAVVLGGGPAGAAFALAWRDLGRSAAILDKPRRPFGRVGETLPPETRSVLAELGVWEAFLGCGPVPSPGVVSIWGGPAPRDHDFVFNPHGSGWHVDRGRFDEMLIGVVESRGVAVLRGARLTSWSRGPSATWLLQVDVDGGRSAIRAKVLVDAAGRSASPVRRLGGGRTLHDRLIGVVGVFAEAAPADHRTWVEAVEDGWWYSIPLPGGGLVAAFMTDADLIPKGTKARERSWSGRLEKTALIRARVDDGATPIRIGQVAANTSLLRCVADDARVAVGDAAATLDPLAGQGVARALISGAAAARAVDERFRGDPAALRSYVRATEADFAADLAERSKVYEAEGRWSDSPFWARRSRGL